MLDPYFQASFLFHTHHSHMKTLRSHPNAMKCTQVVPTANQTKTKLNKPNKNSQRILISPAEELFFVFFNCGKNFPYKWRFIYSVAIIDPVCHTNTVTFSSPNTSPAFSCVVYKERKNCWKTSSILYTILAVCHTVHFSPIRLSSGCVFVTLGCVFVFSWLQDAFLWRQTMTLKKGLSLCTTHTRTRTHMHTQTHTYTHTHAYTCAHTQTHAHIYIHTHTHAHMHAHTHTH